MEWLQLKTVEARQEYKKRRKEVQRETNTTKNEYWEKACDQLNRNMGNTSSNKVWKLIKTIRTNNRKSLTEDPIEFMNTASNVFQEDAIHEIENITPHEMREALKA
nr:unnamed protein product [Callosobruchus analis]